jgi:hypothetical protein
LCLLNAGLLDLFDTIGDCFAFAVENDLTTKRWT